MGKMKRTHLIRTIEWKDVGEGEREGECEMHGNNGGRTSTFQECGHFDNEREESHCP